MLTTLAISWLISAALIYAWFYFIEIVLDLPVTGQTPCSAHATLKAIIRRVLRDASNMAILQEPTQEGEQQEPQNQNNNQTYEDLLATAILNKVIDNYQHGLRRSSSSSSGSRKEKPHKSKKNKHSIALTPAPVVHKEAEKDETWKPQEIDSTSISSIEDWCRSDTSYCSKRIDPVSLTIQHSIEELSTSEDDLINQNSLRISGPSSLDTENWQDNWLFSRKGKTSPKPVPVPMLVPSPNTELRAMIGDRDAEDTSDLSETGSDIDDSENVTSLKNILVDSRTIIGGKNLLDGMNPELLEPHEDFKDYPTTEIHIQAKVIVNGFHHTDNESLDGEIILENGKDECDGKECAVEKVVQVKRNELQNGVSEAKNDVIIKETPYEESDSLDSNTEQDAEYTEKYASFPRPIKKKSPVPSPRVSVAVNGEQNVIIKETVQNNVVENGHEDKNSSEEEGPPVSFEGTYSAREKEKWNNPIKLENNPYSKENLDKRLKNKTIGDNLFGRDYYIRDSKRAAGGKTDENEAIEVSESDFQSPKKLSLLTKSNGFTEELYSEKDSSLESEKLSRPISLALSSDSDDIEVKRIYNVETGQVHKVKPSDITKEIRENAKSPVGIKNFIIQEMFSPAESSSLEEKFDENHNHSYDNENINNITETIMKISSIENLKHIGIKDVPYEEKVESIDLSDEYSLDESQKETLSPSDSSLENGQIRDISKKYLNSLVKNKQPYVVNNFSTPPVSIQESETSISEDLLSVKPLEKNDLKAQSCMDLSTDEIKKSFVDDEYPSLKERKIVSQFIKSVPNFQELEDGGERVRSDRIRMNKSVDILEAEGINEKPSVKNLRKLFDNKNDKVQSVPRNKTSQLELPTNSPKHVHSLTARSLPTLVRKELKIETYEIDISARNGHNQELTQEELAHIKGISRSKIEFFENLRT